MDTPRKNTHAAAPRKRGRPAGSGSAAQTREKILRAGIACFAERGYAQTSNRDIAAGAGITAGSLYHYFDSKAALFEEALRFCTATLLEAYRGACADAAAETTVEQLCLGLERVVAVSREWPGMVRFAGHAAAEIRRSVELHWLEEDTARAFPEFFRTLLRQARARGELAPEIDLDAAADLLLALVAGLSRSPVPDEALASFESQVEMFRLLLRGRLFGPPLDRPSGIPREINLLTD